MSSAPNIRAFSRVSSGKNDCPVDRLLADHLLPDTVEIVDPLIAQSAETAGIFATCCGATEGKAVLEGAIRVAIVDPFLLD
jgi:hypothetical protein